MNAASLLCLSLLLSVAAASPSPGCSLPQQPGSWSSSVPFEGETYSHAYSYPVGASASNPAPLILFFHGWGGSSAECGTSCTLASQRGYATIAMTGIGSENGDWNSWNGFGSTMSGLGEADAPEVALVAGETFCGDAREDDRTCNLGAYDVGCYKDCNNACADKCWWTTCKDSVQQTVNVLEDFINNYCVDMNRIYAVGWSNGGMFTYELANDEKSAKYLAAISPQIGLPHYGYNRGPHANYAIHHFGLWGNRDGTVPPKENPSGQGCSVPCRTSEASGWFYTSSDCVMEKWATDLGLTSDDSVVKDYGIPGYSRIIECSGYTSDTLGNDSVVLGCILNGGHSTTGYHDEVTLNFFDAHSKSDGVTSASPVTGSPVSLAPVTGSPISLAPMTASPISLAPVTSPPISLAPITGSPIAPAPITGSPISLAPVTNSPISLAPVTNPPISLAPATGSPIAPAPITGSPISLAPITGSPISASPVTMPPVSLQPVTGRPTRVPTAKATKAAKGAKVLS